MLTVEERERIRRAYHVEGKSMRQIERELHHSRHTIKKALASGERGRYSLKRPRPAPVLGPYKGQIDELLVKNESLPPKQRYTGHKIYQEIQKEGYQGSRSGVLSYITRQRKAKRKPKVFIPLEFDPGVDAQVDWGEAYVMLAGEKKKVQVFVMRLCYSRKIFVMAFPNQKQEAFFAGHVAAFHHFQGVPQRLTYDNLKAAVFRILAGRERQEQEKFIAFRSHYLFDSHFCTPGQGHQKGGVEHSVGYAIKIYNRRQQEPLAVHARCYGRKQDIFDPLHYLPLLAQRPGALAHAKPIRQWQASWPAVYERLQQHLQQQWPEGRGVREFIRVLQLHREHPPALIEQAVEQAFAYNCAHADGVELCLRQLSQPEPSLPVLDLSDHPTLAEFGQQAPDLSPYNQLLGTGGSPCQ